MTTLEIKIANSSSVTYITLNYLQSLNLQKMVSIYWRLKDSCFHILAFVHCFGQQKLTYPIVSLMLVSTVVLWKQEFMENSYWNRKIKEKLEKIAHFLLAKHYIIIVMHLTYEWFVFLFLIHIYFYTSPFANN